MMCFPINNSNIPVMKNIILLLVCLSLKSNINCQISERDSMANVIAEYIQKVGDAADIFLNTQLPTEDRLNAMAPYPFIYDESQVDPFKKVVISNDEQQDIRAMALSKIYQYVENDERLLDQVIQWLGSAETPVALRDETLNLISALSFSSLTGILDIYPKMLDDPDIRFRYFAASKLLLNGDARTQQLLIRGLENPQSAIFEPSLAIDLLALSPKREFYPAAYKILLESQNDSARLAALRILGSYQPARKKIISISQDANETEEFRESALMSLYSGDRDNIVALIAPILQDSSASMSLQALGIQISIDVRKSMAYRRSRKARRADDYDRLIKAISEGKGVNQSQELKDLATKYLLLVKPNF